MLQRGLNPTNIQHISREVSQEKLLIGEYLLRKRLLQLMVLLQNTCTGLRGQIYRTSNRDEQGQQTKLEEKIKLEVVKPLQSKDLYKAGVHAYR